ncbi:Cellulose synthase catalytic subunit [UDP-forming] [Pseudoruegeria aquimaris]|uniref:Cellulose synthase catalytic subunit [UDP-forming] n=1 Tax=Pseudoruegeria aquimaris TaxID=393663 RepID=A0A1Y5TJM4_9RHOB|nr:cellulose synthase catalytic subunit [Pseudoruegeria aquimaris]SLN61947.1 Cellulose synthase catalytic subunit [UDP-forming] [Pseudoruegeria aquimaris]
MESFHFTPFEHRQPPRAQAPSQRHLRLWHFLAAMSLGLGAWYLHWRWTATLNPDAMIFSVLVASAETLAYVGCILFFHDIWAPKDTPPAPPPRSRAEAGLAGDGPIRVDILITTYDEPPEIVALSIRAARALRLPEGCEANVYVLDDGNRPAMAAVAQREGALYISRDRNTGFKAGNLRNALLRTDGDFFVICDADTRLFPRFLENTLGYFRDPAVAWVQTPHWFYDIPANADGTGEQDVFLCDPGLFFDIIQRRRHRNNASFCCGAGSIHRREAVFASALMEYGARAAAPAERRFALAARDLQPFRYHVSEDIYTSILVQSDPGGPWRSVYHPQVESRMLSPWGLKAWAAQRLKYAGGSLDILFHDNPLIRKGLPWRTRLHYGATFWSYLSCLWLPILLAAPVVALLTGTAPLRAGIGEFFLHLLPVLIVTELALIAGCWGQDVSKGRLLAIATLPLTLKALWQVIRRRKIGFAPTPKIPLYSEALRIIWPHLLLIGISLAAAAYALWQASLGQSSLGLPFLLVNLFWISWNIYMLSAAPRAALWRPKASR